MAQKVSALDAYAEELRNGRTRVLGKPWSTLPDGEVPPSAAMPQAFVLARQLQ
jgi:hypothetical protein